MLKKVLAALLGAAAVLALSPGLVAEAAPAPKPFPVVLGTPMGKLTIRKQPRRIVSLSPSRAETLFAIGAGRGVVAVDELSNYRPVRAPDEALGLHAERRGDRRLPPRPRDRARRRRADGLARQARHPRARPARGLEAPASLRAGYAAGTRDRPPEGRGRDYCIRSMRTRISKALKSVP